MIKNKLKLGLVLTATIGALLGLTSNALAVDEITWNADTTVTLTGASDRQVTILSGSQATSFAVSGTTITATVGSGDTFTIRSTTNRYNLANDGNVNIECTSSYSQVNIRGGTVIVTPAAATCTIPSTGGGGGGGSSQVDWTGPTSPSVIIAAGASTTASASVTLALSATDSSGVVNMMISNDSLFTGALWESYATSKAWTLTSGVGTKTVYARFRDAYGNVSADATDSITVTAAGTTPAPAPTPSPTPAPTPAPLPSPLVVPTAGQSGKVPPGILTKAMTIGEKGNEVTVLQNFLKAQGADIYPEGLVTGYYGPATTRAIQRLQLKYGIVSAPGEAGYGNLGPKTRTKVNELLGGTAPAPTPSPTPAPTPAPSAGGLQRAMGVGSSGADVTTLQNFLKAQGTDIYPEGLVTGYYGPATTRAIQRLQEKYGIANPGEAGYGNLGPKTRAKVNELLGQ